MGRFAFLGCAVVSRLRSLVGNERRHSTPKNDPDPDPESYVLSKEESRAIFERDIVPAELAALSLPAEPNVGDNVATDARLPLAVLLIGQTGAGKTRTAPAIKEAMVRLRGDRRLAHFVADTYKTYHPAYLTLLATHPALASPVTRTDARRWLVWAAAYATQHRADVLVESAPRHPADFADLVSFFFGASYRVEVAILAVPAALSRLEILTRFYEGLPEAGPQGGLPIRLTPRNIHDESYAGLLEAAAFVDSSEGVEQVLVVRRDNMVAYVNECIGDQGFWKRELYIAEAVRAERERPLTLNEKRDAEYSLQKLRNMKVPGLEEELVEIEGLLKPLMVNLDGAAYTPLRPLRLPNSVQDKDFDTETGLKLGVISHITGYHALPLKFTNPSTGFIDFSLHSSM